MTKHQQERRKRLLPNGVPRYVRCYDNGGESADRYTVVFTGNYPKGDGINKEFGYRAMSGSPCHPQGVGLWGSIGPWSSPPWNGPVDTIGFKNGKRCYVWPPAIGRKCHLGKRIHFKDLPEECRKLVLQDYLEVWNLNAKAAKTPKE